MKKTSEAQLRAGAKYDKDHTYQINLKLNKKTDADIIDYLNSKDNKQGFIKIVIREFMRLDGLYKAPFN